MHNYLEFRIIQVSLLLSCTASAFSNYRVDLTCDGPVVRGANVTFTAYVYDESGRFASGSLKYDWHDTAVPTHKKTSESDKPTDVWVVTYDGPQGLYVTQVTVCRTFMTFCYGIASSRIVFYVNETLNGDLSLIQKNQTRSDIFVSNADTVVHNVSLKETDASLVRKAPTVLTYWFIDCTYYGVNRDFSFAFNYTKADEEHFVEALVVVDFTPLPPPTTTPVPTTTTTTTTTPKPTTTTTSSTTAATTTSTTASTTISTKTTSVTTTTAKTTQTPKNTTGIMVNVNGTLQPHQESFPLVCNGSHLAMDPDKIYGYFFKRVKVRAPVSNVNVTGNNWLQHGDLLTLNVKCHGSRNLRYCVKYEKGVYNVTGKEKCFYHTELEKCEFTIQRYFVESMQHTIVIIIENEVSKVVTPVAVTVYKVKKQAQLSVIVVPVGFSLVAVVLIVFGVAYYIQNRSRFVVEVADFNFGQNYSDMEYKTFKERLRDSIANAFSSRVPTPGSSEVPVWPPGRKYGSMTS